MLVKLPQAGFQAQRVRFERKNEVSQAVVPRFSGIADEFEANKAQQTRKFYQDIIQKNQKAFFQPVLQAGDRSLTGVELMSLVQELGYKSTWSMTSGKHKGAKTVWSYDIKTVLYPPEVWGDALDERFRAAYDKLVETGCFLFETQPKSSKENGGRWFVYLPAVGTNTLAEIRKLQAEGQLNALLKTSNGSTLKTESNTPASKAKTPLTKLDQLRYLIAKNGNDYTGWDVLKKLVQADDARNGIARYFFPGLKEPEWRKRIQVSNIRAFKAALAQFQEMGILTVKGSGNGARFVLTEKAREMAGCPDVSQAVEMTRDDYKAYFKSEIEQLDNDKKKKQQQIQGFEDQYQADSTQLETLKTSLDEKKAAVLAAHEAAKNEPDATQSAKKLEQVAESLLELDSLTNDVNARQEQLQQRKNQADAAKVFFAKWRQQTHQRVQRLQQLLFQLETTEVNKGINDFLTEMQALENQQQSGGDGLNSLLTPMVESVQIDYHVSKELAGQEDVSVRLAEEKAYQSMQLDAAIAQLKSEKQGKQGVVPSTTDAALSSITPSPAMQPAAKKGQQTQ